MGVSSVRRRYRRYYRDPTTDKRLPPKKKPPDRNQRTTSPNNARQISRLECEVQRRFVRHVLQYRRGTARIKAGKRASSLPWYKVRARANQRHDFYRPIGTTPPQQRGARLKHLRKAPPSKHLASSKSQRFQSPLLHGSFFGLISHRFCICPCDADYAIPVLPHLLYKGVTLCVQI